MPRPKHIRNALIVLAVLLCAGLGLFLWQIDRQWQGMLARADRIRTRLETLDDTRPVLWGESTPGDAWQDYTRAIEMVESSGAYVAWADYRQLRRRDDLDAARRLRDEILDRNAGALGALRAGAHRSRARFPIRWEKGFGASTASILQARALADAAVQRAHRSFEDGDAVGAAQQLLDAMQFGRDLMHSRVLINEMIGAAVLAMASKEALEQDDLLIRLPRPALLVLSTGMAVLDEHIRPASLSHHAELVLFAQQVRQTPGAALSGQPYGTTMMAWRYGFSRKLICADYTRQLELHADLMVENAAKPWSERSAALDESLRALEASPNPLIALMPSMLNKTRDRLQSVALLRIVRMAVDHRAYGEVRPLADPLGDTLEHRDVGGDIRFWSEGGGMTSPNPLRIQVPRAAAGREGR